MRKQSKRKKRAASPPTLVAVTINPDYEISELIALECLRQGTATEGHFNTLTECRNMLAAAGAIRNDRAILAVGDMASIALESIKARYLSKGRMGATGEELKALEALAFVSLDFWKLQSGELFKSAYYIVERSRELSKEGRA